MKAKYSIVITVYNKEKYLHRCLNSVVKQTYKKKYNIIVVDDGSTDNSASIIKEYSKKYDNIYYYYKENTGVADTRNFAISKVESDFFLFVDADDYISKDLLKKVNVYTNKNVDIVSFSFYQVDNEIRSFSQHIKNEFFEISGKQAIIIYSCNQNRYLFDVPWGYVYRTEFFKQNNFKYLYGTEHEDVSLTPIIITSAKKITSIKYKGYFYVENLDSLTHDYLTEQKRIIDKLNHLKILSLFYQKQDFDDISLELLRYNVLYKILKIPIEINFNNFDFYIKQLKELKMYEIIPNSSKTYKIYRWLFKRTPHLLVVFYLTYIHIHTYSNLPYYIENFIDKMRKFGQNRYKRIIEYTNKSYYLMRFKRTTLFFFSLLIHMPLLLNKNYIKLNYVELVITTKCNLKCAKCSNLIPLYKKEACNISYDDLMIQIDSLLKNVDQIDLFRVLGGEPFLHPNLDRILEKLLKSKKIKNIMIPTNGSIIPQNTNLIYILKNPKICIDIGFYDVLNSKTEQFLKFLKEEKIKIHYYSKRKNNYWLDYGDAVNKNRTADKLKRQFNNCNDIRKCLNYYKGKLHICPRSAHLMDLKIISDNPSEYVNLLNNHKFKNKRKEIIEFLSSTEYITACNYCNIGTDEEKTIAVAEQINDNEE